MKFNQPYKIARTPVDGSNWKTDEQERSKLTTRRDVWRKEICIKISRAQPPSWCKLQEICNGATKHVVISNCTWKTRKNVNSTLRSRNVLPVPPPRTVHEHLTQSRATPRPSWSSRPQRTLLKIATERARAELVNQVGYIYQRIFAHMLMRCLRQRKSCTATSVGYK